MPGNPRRLLAAAVVPAAVTAMLALAVPAGASTGMAEISPEQAGYTATGAQFQTITASVFLRQQEQYTSEVASYGHSVQLWSSGLVVTLGVTASTSSEAAYVTYVTIYDRSTHQVIASNPNAQSCNDDDFCVPGVSHFFPGYTLTMKISYSPADGQLTMTEDYPGGYFTSAYTATDLPQSFTEARVGTDFGSTPWDGSYTYTPPARQTKAAAYSNVALTTYSGHTSTLWSWWVHHKLLANTGQQSGADWVAIPADLTNGGANFQTLFVPVSGQGPNQPVLH